MVTALVTGFFFSSRRRHTIWNCDWSSDVCSSDLAAARDHGRTLRLADEPGDALDGVGVWRRPEVGREVLGRFWDIGRAEEHVKGNVHEHGSGAPAQRRADQFGCRPVSIFGRGQRERLLREAPDDLDVVHLLQRAHPPARFRRAASDHEHGAVGRLCLRESRHRVGDARAGGDRRDAAFARDLRPPFRRERRRLLVAHVDDADAVLLGPDEDRPDVAAVEREKVADAGALERQHDQLAGVGRVAHLADAHGIAGVLNAACGGPVRPRRITPPWACIALPKRSTAPCATAEGSIPCCSSTTMSRARPRRMKASPWPVPQTAPNRSSAYMPAPGMGESPIRPGSLPLMPPVETATASLPSESRATAPTVSAPVSPCWRLRLLMKTDGSHISTPWSRAKREAPDPESSTWRPSRITSAARSTGWRTSFKHATPPARRAAPSITPASSSTSPSAFRQAPMPAFSMGSSSIWRTAAIAAIKAPLPIWAQPSSRARSTAAWRWERSAEGTGPAPPWTTSAGAARGFSSGLLEGPAIRDPAFVGPPVRHENDAPADRRALRCSPLGEPPLGVRAPHRRTSFRAALNPHLFSHHTHPLAFWSERRCYLTLGSSALRFSSRRRSDWRRSSSSPGPRSTK